MKIQNPEVASLVEGIPELAGGLNLALYDWLVGSGEILRAIHGETGKG